MEINELTYQEQVELFKKTYASEDERRSFAASFSLPLLQSVQEQSTVRQIFAVDVLPPGAPSTYPMDFPDIDAWVMPGQGQVPQNIISGAELHIPTFEIATSAEWKLQYARDGRFNVAQRAMQKVRDAIVREEEEAGWATIRAAVNESNTISNAEWKGLSKSALNGIFKKMQENRGYKVDIIAVNSVRAGDIREWGYTDLDDTTRREVYNNAGMGSIWGAQIMIVDRLSNDEVYAFDVNKFGIMPVREEIQTFDDPSAINKLRVRVVAFEDVGFAAIDSKAIVKLDLSQQGG